MKRISYKLKFILLFTLFGALSVFTVSALHYYTLSKNQKENFLINAKEVVSLRAQLFEHRLLSSDNQLSLTQASELLANQGKSVYGYFNLIDQEGRFLIYRDTLLKDKIIYLKDVYPNRAEDIEFADVYVAQEMYAKSIRAGEGLEYKVILEMSNTLFLERRDELLQWTLLLFGLVSLLSLPLAILFSIIPDRLNKKVLQHSNALEELNITLEKRVEEEVNIRRTKEKMLVHQSKMAAMAAMGEMIGAIAHQWRQPLNALGLIGSAVKMDFDFGKLDETKMNTSIDKINYQIQFMSKTIDDFKNFFKDDKAKAHFDVATAIQEVITLLSSQIIENDITIYFSCKDEGKEIVNIGFDESKALFGDYSAMVDGFRNEFKQVILNIINNAKDVFIEKSLKGEVIIVVDKQDKKVKTTIEDNGGGIPSGIIEDIFEPYFSTKGEDGTGVGLDMSKTIIEENMQGIITVQNSAKGAIFAIELQIAEEIIEEIIEPSITQEPSTPMQKREVIDAKEAEDYMNDLFEDFGDKNDQV
jgi:signal transduction histidine kinase